MIEHGWFDSDFVRDWTNGPFLVRDDDRDACCDRRQGSGFRRVGRGARHATSATTRRTRAYAEPPVRLALRGAFTIATRDGPVACRPAFDHLRHAVPRRTRPNVAAAITGIDAEAIRAGCAPALAPSAVAYFTWTGLEQHTNATHTARAHAILHALTGCIDVPGGNMQFAQVPVNDISGAELRPPGQWQKALGRGERPLGIGGRRLGHLGRTLPCDHRRAAISGARAGRIRRQPAAVARDAAREAREALGALEFHVQTDLYLTPTVAVRRYRPADRERVGARRSVRRVPGRSACQRVGPAAARPLVPPRGEARADIDMVFDLAVRLGLGEHFWHGDVDGGTAASIWRRAG